MRSGVESRGDLEEGISTEAVEFKGLRENFWLWREKRGIKGVCELSKKTQPTQTKQLCNTLLNTRITYQTTLQ